MIMMVINTAKSLIVDRTYTTHTHTQKAILISATSLTIQTIPAPAYTEHRVITD